MILCKDLLGYKYTNKNSVKKEIKWLLKLIHLAADLDWQSLDTRGPVKHNRWPKNYLEFCQQRIFKMTWGELQELQDNETTTQFLFFFLRFYLFIHERHRERDEEAQAEGEAGSMQGVRRGNSIPGPQDHTLGRRQMLNHWATQPSLPLNF